VLKSIKGIERILVNEKANEMLVVVDGSKNSVQDRELITKTISERLKKNRDAGIEIVRSAKDCSLDAMFENYWTFFCSLWARTFPAGRPWFESCTYKLNQMHLFVEFDEQLAIRALSDRNFEGFTRKIVRALSGKEIAVSIRVKENVDHEYFSDDQDDPRDEELEEIKRIIRQNVKTFIPKDSRRYLWLPT